MKSFKFGQCKFCKGPNDPYMVTKELWDSVIGEHGNQKVEYSMNWETGERKKIKETGSPVLACLKCFEEKLGRRLRLEDFIDAPINYGSMGFDCREYVKGKEER